MSTRPTSSSTYITEKSSAAETSASAATRNQPQLGPHDTYARQALMFTGPDGLRHHRVTTHSNPEVVGENEASQERTGALSYMFRAPKDSPFPLAKNGRLGEIGGEVDRWNIKKGI